MRGNATCPRRSFEDYWSLSTRGCSATNLSSPRRAPEYPALILPSNPALSPIPTLQLPRKGPRANEGLPCKEPLFTATQDRCAADRSSPSHHGSAECRRSPSGAAHNSRPADLSLGGAAPLS